MRFQTIRKYLAILFGVLCLGASDYTLAAISIQDNNTHIDRGVSYSNLPFLTASGGTAPYTFTVNSGLPAGITVASNGTLSGLTCGKNGNFGINVSVTDSVGGTASATNLSLIVNAAPTSGCSLSFTTSTLPSGTAGTAYSTTITASGGTAPYSYSVASGSLPPGLSLSSNGTISGTPTAAGTYTFTITASDSGGATGSITYTLTISAPTITVSGPGVTSATVGLAYAQSVSASGGTSPYTYAVTVGSLPAGLSLNASTGAITGTPSAAGGVTFTITATDANGFTGAASVTLTVAAASRPDPTQDADVRANQGAQTDMVNRYFGTQITNVMRRLEDLQNPVGGFDDSLCLGLSNGSDGKAQSASLCAEHKTGATSLSGWAAWVAGTLDYGDQNSNLGVSDRTFSSNGMTFGADYRLSEEIFLGFALGYGFGGTEVGQNGSRVDGSSMSFVGYSNWNLGKRLRVGVLLGYGTAQFDTQRWVAQDSVIVRGNRSGTGAFGSLLASVGIANPLFDLSSYLRTDFIHAKLDAYQESGNSSLTLAYDEATVRTTTGVFGVRAAYPMFVGLGVIEPNLRLEYQRRNDSGDAQGMHYVDQPSGADYLLVMPMADGNATVVGLGARFRMRKGITAGIEYQRGYSSGDAIGSSLRANLATSF